MPVIDKSLEELKIYRGITPCPADFDDYWNTALLGSSVGPAIKAMSANDFETLRSGVQQRLPLQADGHMVVSARAHAVTGRVPG